MEMESSKAERKNTSEKDEKQGDMTSAKYAQPLILIADEDKPNRDKQCISTYLWQGFADIQLISLSSLGQIRIANVAFGQHHSLFLSSEGQVLVKGANDCGQLGLGSLDIKAVEEPVMLKGLSGPGTMVACGFQHSAVVTDSGQVFCWGDSTDGQCGTGTLDLVLCPTHVVVEIHQGFCEHGFPRPSTPVAVCQVDCGARHCLALSQDGDVWAWGCGPQLGLGELQHAPIPRRLDCLQGRTALSVCCGDSHSMVLLQTVASSRSSPVKQKPVKSLKAATKQSTDIKEDKDFPSRCSICDREIFTYTDTSDMCIVDDVHDCSKGFSTEKVDSTIVEEVSTSGSSSSDVETTSEATADRFGGSSLLFDSGHFLKSNDEDTSAILNKEQEKVKQEERNIVNQTDAQCLDDCDKTEDSNNTYRLRSINIQANEILDDSLLETSIFETSAMDVSMLVIPGDGPFRESNDTNKQPLSSVPEHEPEKIMDKRDEMNHTESSIVKRNSADDDDNDIEEVWQKRKSEDVTADCQKPSVRRPSTGSIKSLLNPSEAMDYLQRQLGEDADELAESDQHVKHQKQINAAVNASSELESPDKSDDVINMMEQMKLMNSQIFKDEETETTSSNTTAEPADNQSSSNLTRSGTFAEWKKELSNVGSNLSETGDKRRSLRTIHMQQSRLSHKSTSSTSSELADIPSFSPMITATEVWCWGVNTEGQLGVGDSIDRDVPIHVKNLAGCHVVKLAGGKCHSLALTANSQVYSWGSNAYGQLGQQQVGLAPYRIKFMKGVMVWDIAAGTSHSLFLGDTSVMKPDVFFCGKQPAVGKHSSLKKSNLPKVLNELKKVGKITKVMSGGPFCACQVLTAPNSDLNALFELSATERTFYNQLIKTMNILLRPLQKSAFFSSMDVFPYKSSLQNLVSSFAVLAKIIKEGVTDLNNAIQNMRHLSSTLHLGSHLQLVKAFSLYSKAFSDFLAVGGFAYCTNAGSEFFETVQGSISDLSEEKDKTVASSTLFMRAMRYPFFRLAEYSRIITKMGSDAQSIEQKNVFSAIVLDWDSTKLKLANEHKIADTTRLYWETAHPKVMDALCSPGRRVLRDSKTQPISWQGGGRFTSHNFVLFDDIFMHFQNTGLTMHPLETVWVDSGNSSSEHANHITIILPEDRYEMTASSPAQKAEWLVAFNSAISKVLTDQKSIPSHHSSGERFTPPLIRHATHTFVKAGIYKGSTYLGTWLSGKLHGLGELKWPDGSVYEGKFKTGLLHGTGKLTLQKTQGVEEQKGVWKDGKLNGFAIVTYANGDLYEGHFQDGLRFGHGMYQAGRHKSSCASVYIGEWLSNLREGYGVQDDIHKGEKYMGMWVEDQRHGNGVLVTLDGMYFEGNFVQNRMTGFGVMLSDDDTLYEGDFLGITHLAGKGTLTLSTGDKLEGSFSGSLNEGLKVSGTFVKAASQSDTDKKGQHSCTKSKYFGRLCISSDAKWTDIFTHVTASLGQVVINANKSQPVVDTEKAWEMVAVLVSAGRKSLNEDKSISSSKAKVQLKLLDTLEKIPAHQEGSLSKEILDQMKVYLSQACDSNYHPLGLLMSSLVDVFRASYIGVGAHPRLLHHALQEVRSYVRRYYKVLRLLFPNLPANGGPVHVYPASRGPLTVGAQSGFVEGLEVEDPNMQMLTAAGLLYPLLLPKLYPPLFDLYALHNEASDDRYWERVTRLNRQSDMGLMAYLDIDQRFWLLGNILKPGQAAVKDVCYAEAVDTLQQLSTAFSPLDKLHVIEMTFTQITTTVTSSVEESVMWTMDDLFPIFQFVVVRAKINHLGAELQLLEDLMEPHMEHGELGLMFTIVKACYFQIQNEKLPQH